MDAKELRENIAQSLGGENRSSSVYWVDDYDFISNLEPVSARERPPLRGKDAERFIERAKKNEENLKTRLDESLKQMNLIREGKSPKKSWKELYEELRKGDEDRKDKIVKMTEEACDKNGVALRRLRDKDGE